MNVVAESILIKSLFTKGQFLIPNYQREYDWDDSNILELWEDLEEAAPDENYFIGHMIFEGEYKSDRFFVIDGQQRITTITILLCAIRDRFLELGKDALADAIHNKYVYTIDLNNQKKPILENKMPYPILQDRVQAKPGERLNGKEPQKKGEKRIVAAYDMFKSLLASHNEEALSLLRDKILNLETIFVSASDLGSASTIFMTLNSTGKDLSSFDLVKNYLFSLFPRVYQVDEPNDTWTEILTNISDKDKTFLNNSFASRYKKVSDKRIFKEIVRTAKKAIDREKFSKDFLTALKEDASLYRKITKMRPEEWSREDYKIAESINAVVSVFCVKVANPFFIALLRAYEDRLLKKSQVLRTLSIIEKFHFLNNAICSKRSSGLDNSYSKYAVQLFNASTSQKRATVLQELGKFLIARLPSKDEFCSVFDQKVYFRSNESKQKALVSYVLHKLEYWENPNAIFVDCSIEHIYPETQGSSWPDLKNFALVKNIGNLVLLDSELNSKIGNKGYIHKRRAVLEKTKLETTKRAFEPTSWLDSEILSRNEEIKSRLYSNGF